MHPFQRGPAGPCRIAAIARRDALESQSPMRDSQTSAGAGNVLPAAAHFLPDGTPVSAPLHGHDWSRSPLGLPGTWPRALRAAVAMMQDSPLPMWLGWGPGLGMVYNTGYVELLADKHPQALGAPLQQVWAEIWADIDPLVASALAGRAIVREDLPLMVNRRGRDEPAWFTFSYSPLRDDDGSVAGMICTVWETTERVQRIARIREAEERYRLAVLATNDAIWDWRLAACAARGRRDDAGLAAAHVARLGPRPGHGLQHRLCRPAGG